MKRNEKLLISGLVLWTFLHGYYFLTGRMLAVEYEEEYSSASEFVIPYDKPDYILARYDLTEFFVFVGLPWVLYLLYRFLKN
jgi:hypothetical protein